MFKEVQRSIWRHAHRHMRTSRAYTDAQLRSSEQSCTVMDRAIARIDIAHLPANHPTEDYYAAAKCLSSEAFLFGNNHCFFIFFIPFFLVFSNLHFRLDE